MFESFVLICNGTIKKWWQRSKNPYGIRRISREINPNIYRNQSINRGKPCISPVNRLAQHIFVFGLCFLILFCFLLFFRFILCFYVFIYNPHALVGCYAGLQYLVIRSNGIEPRQVLTETVQFIIRPFLICFEHI